MADVLSQKQIDELLNSFSANGSKAFEEIEENADKRPRYMTSRCRRSSRRKSSR